MSTTRKSRKPVTLPEKPIAAHTPGPWEFKVEDGGDFVRVFSEEWGGIATLHDPLARELNRTDMLEANGRLIAAAPSLLAALQAIVDLPAHPMRKRGVEIARAALAKTG